MSPGTRSRSQQPALHVPFTTCGPWGWALATPHMGTKLRSAEDLLRLEAKPEELSMETSHPDRAVSSLG